MRANRPGDLFWNERDQNETDVKRFPFTRYAEQSKNDSLLYCLSIDSELYIFMLNFIKNSIGRDAWIINDIMIKKCHQGSIDEKTGWKEAGQSLSQFLSIKHLKILARVGPILALG